MTRLNLVDAASLMEEKATRFRKFPKPLQLTPPTNPCEVKKELLCLSQILRDISYELEDLRSQVKRKEQRLLLFTNYKWHLEKTQITPTIVTISPKKKDKVTELLEKLEALTPSQLERLEGLEL